MIKTPLFIELERNKKQQKQSNRQAYIDNRQKKNENPDVHSHSNNRRASSLRFRSNASMATTSPAKTNSNSDQKDQNSNFFSKIGVDRKKSKVQFSNSSAAVKTTKELKLGYSEFYLSLTLLQNYQEMNFTGFRKILKKHDKITETEYGLNFRLDRVEKTAFFSNNSVNNLILQVEAVMTELEDGDRSKAMKRLRVPPLDKTKDYPIWVVYRVGFFTGVLLMTLTMLVYKSFLIVNLSERNLEEVQNQIANDNKNNNTEDLLSRYNREADEIVTPDLIDPRLNNETHQTDSNQEKIPVSSLSVSYRLVRYFWLLRPLLFTWIFITFLGVNIYAFKCVGVNHVLIFEIDPRDHLGHIHFLEIGTALGIVWAGCMNLYASSLLHELYYEENQENLLNGAFHYMYRNFWGWLNLVILRFFGNPKVNV